MSPTLFFPRLSNTLHFSCNSAQIPKPIQSSHRTPPNLTSSSVRSPINGGNSDFEADNEELSSSSSKPSSDVSSVIKAPTAPWMRGPLLVQPNQVLDLSEPRTRKYSSFSKTVDPDKALTAKIGPGRGKREMKMVLKGIKKLRAFESSEKSYKDPENVKFRFQPGQLWGDGRPEFDEKVLFLGENKLMETGKNVDLKEFDFQLGEVERREKSKVGKKMPWEGNENLISVRVVKEKVVTAAELKLDKALLERLRDEASRMRVWVKVNKAGVTQAVVDQVHFTWKKNELAMIKFDLPLCRNMDRAREIVEVCYNSYNFSFSIVSSL